MNNEEFETLVSNIAPHSVRAALRARDTAQREAIKRLEASLAHACVLLGEADYQARLWEDYQTENEMEVEDHWVTSQVRDRIYKFLDGFKVAELVRSTYSFPRLVSWSEEMSTCTLIFKEREYYFDLSDDCKDDDAQAEQQEAPKREEEAQGAQAGDEPKIPPMGKLDIPVSGVPLNECHSCGWLGGENEVPGEDDQCYCPNCHSDNIDDDVNLPRLFHLVRYLARAALATQPAVPASVEAMSFEYAHLSGERRTVSITREDVIEGMEDALYEKLSDQICRCEPIGETNVVECNCQDYVEEFALVSAKPAVRGAEHDQ